MASSAEILNRFCRARDGIIRLALEPAYIDLLEKLGNPHKKLPPVIHVAGTNGKGSTCAFLRAMLEAAGKNVHVYTSPHLVTFHERIRAAGELISESELVEILTECEKLAEPGKVSDFEVATAAAFVVFARYPADAAILEVGMGGRLDATNVIDKPAASVIARLSYDHTKHLGSTLTEIAREKAGIMRPGIPCFVASQQPQEEGMEALLKCAMEIGTPLSIGGTDWRIEPNANGFHFIDSKRTLNLPQPSLLGPHQLWNAGLAIAALSALPFAIPDEAIAEGVQSAEWPARLQKITQGALAALLPYGWELWLDGGHNDSAGEVLAQQMNNWRDEDNQPMHLIFGMLNTKNPCDFLMPLAPYINAARTLTIPNEPLSFRAADLVIEAQRSGLRNCATAKNLVSAISELTRQSQHGRILICGSLYLAGHVLKLNQQAQQKLSA